MSGRDRRTVATLIPYLFAFIAFALDQLSKIAVSAAIPFGESIPLAGLYLTPTQNTGAAFGLLQGYGPFLAILAAATAIAVFAFGKKGGRSRLTGAALGLLVGGALGNLTDRIVRGYVYDFIDVRFWPVFNLADCAITIGVGILILELLFLERRRR